jgi:adenylate kinase family enzyme
MNAVSESLLVLLGPPGCGKSTLVEAIFSAYPSLGHFAVRRQFVVEKRNTSDLWLAAAESQEEGEWIPDPVVMEAFTRRFDAQGTGGMLVEGLPANARQASLLIEAVRARGQNIDVILYLDAPDKVCMQRMRGRQVCFTCDGGISHAEIAEKGAGKCGRCGAPLGRRKDDSDTPFAERLRLHRHHIGGILDELGRDRVVVIDATASREQIAQAALSSLAGFSSRISAAQ